MSPPASGNPAPVAPTGPAPALPATSPYAVVVQNYPGPFATQIKIPVVDDKNLKLKPEVRADAQIGTDFEFSLEDALNAAARHLFIRDAAGKNHDNPEEVVEDWLNLLRWEVQTFWTVKPADHWYGEDRQPGDLHHVRAPPPGRRDARRGHRRVVRRAPARDPARQDVLLRGLGRHGEA